MKILTIMKLPTQIMISLMLFSTYAHAAISCPDEMFKDPLKDITKFSSKELAQHIEKYEEDEKPYYVATNNHVAVYDLRTEIRQTTTNPSDLVYDFYGKGMIYNPNRDQYEGSGNMISPCHTLTAYHAIDSEKKPIESNLNRQVVFDFFKNPSGYNYTKRKMGAVVAGSNDKNLDYAIIKLDKPKDKETIPYLLPEYDDVSNIDQCLSVSTGNPASHYTPAKPAALYGMKVRMYSNNKILEGYVNLSPGNSGGSIDTYCVENKKFRITGLASGGNYIKTTGEDTLNTGIKVIATPAIFKDLALKNPRLLAEIQSAQKSGICK